MNKKMQAVEHLLDSARGIYIPRDFYQLYCKDMESVFDGLNTVSMAELDNPENEGYWETWSDALDRLSYTCPDGNVFKLYQDGDLWLICYELMTDEEKINFGLDVEEMEE